MIEIQCTSCHTRYRIDERVLPDDTPTFKCSRCGHVFTREPRAPKIKAGNEPSPAAPRPPRADPGGDPRSAIGRGVGRTVLAESAPPATQRAPVAGHQQPPPAENPLERSLAEADEEIKSGENLAFDFPADDEPQMGGEVYDHRPESDSGWQVGESEFEFDEPGAAGGPLESQPGPTALSAAPPATPMEEPEPARPKRLHSSGFFLAIFLFVGLCFGALSLLIAGSPEDSADLFAQLPGIGERFAKPVTPGSRARLQDVRTSYQRLKETQDHPALMVSGVVRNVSGQPLHAVRIAVELLDGQGRSLARQGIYCGNTISSRMIMEMTRRELDFFQRLDPPKGFVLGNDQTWPFLVVFVDPPAALARFRIAVTRAQPADEQPATGA